MNLRSIVSLIFLATGSCGHENRETKIFSNYLKENFNQQLSDSVKLYLVIPSTGCGGCTTAKLNTALDCLENNKLLTHAILIYAKKGFVAQEINDKIEHYFDETSALDALNLELINLTLISTKKHKVTHIYPTRAEEPDEFICNFIKSNLRN